LLQLRLGSVSLPLQPVVAAVEQLHLTRLDIAHRHVPARLLFLLLPTNTRVRLPQLLRLL
jgi:hypothetical protein